MSQTHQQYGYIPPTHITPIACPRCGSNAHLMRRTPHPELAGELRTFECKDCGAKTEMAVRD